MPEDEYDDDESMPWENAATEAVNAALEGADFDDLNGVVVVPGDNDPRFAHHCRSLDELRSALVDIYDEQWYANVPFDGGEAVFEGDGEDYVAELLENKKIESFFEQLGENPPGEIIMRSTDLLLPAASKIVRVDLEEINDELIAYLAKHPEKMHELNWRDFEKLVAKLFEDKGYDVHLMPGSKDGGVDIRAYSKSEIGTILTLIQCKRPDEGNKVGVEYVRSLYGVTEAEGATKGLLATTSYFTKGAIKFQNDLQYRLTLANYDVVCEMLEEWKKDN